MHDSLFTNPPARDAAQLTAQAQKLGLDEKKFADCLNGGTHAAAIRESIARMQQLRVEGTPLTLVGLTPAPGSPMKVDRQRPGRRAVAPSLRLPAAVRPAGTALP
jgi:predicted DsbA family dithiol-disulfide isomerase